MQKPDDTEARTVRVTLSDGEFKELYDAAKAQGIRTVPAFLRFAALRLARQ